MKHELFVTTTQSGALRGKWEFDYDVLALAEAAGKQAQDRLTRKGRWEVRYREVLAKIKESGITVSESQAKQMSSSTYGRRPSLNVAPELENDLIECHDRIELHYLAAENYRAWQAVLLNQPRERKVTLTQADWLYFFGGLDKEE